MSLDRTVLAVSSAFVLLAGIACVLAPANFAEQAGLSAAPQNLTEIRAFYGGLQIGVGCFLIWCLRERTRTFVGLLLVGLAVGGAGLGRALGMLLDRDPTAFHLTNLAIEVATVGLVAAAVARNRRRTEA